MGKAIGVRMVCGGRGKGKMMTLNEFLESLPEDMREKVIVIRAASQKEELRGNNILKTVWNG